MNRGLTLIEVVVSAVLLAIVGATCASFLRDAARDASTARSTTQHEAVRDLGEAANAILVSQPALAGRLLEQHGRLTLDWPDATDRREVIVSVGSMHEAEPGAPEPSHAWLIFEAEGVAVARWVRLPTRRPEGDR